MNNVAAMGTAALFLAIATAANAQNATEFDAVSNDEAAAVANVFMSWAAVHIVDVPPPYDVSHPAPDTIVINHTGLGIWGVDCAFEFGDYKRHQPLAMIDFKAFTGEYQQQATPYGIRVTAFGNGHPVAWRKGDSGESYSTNYISLELRDPRSLLRSLHFMIGGACPVATTKPY